MNSAYRFVGWGAIPIGAACGGGIVSLADTQLSRQWALRFVGLVLAGVHACVLAGTVIRLTTAAIERAAQLTV